MGKRKKLENVRASNNSFTDITINSTRNVDVIAMNSTAVINIPQRIPDRSIRKAANSNGMKAFMIPNMIAPVVFATMSRLMLIGDSNNRSNDLLFRSKVMVTLALMLFQTIRKRP